MPQNLGCSCTGPGSGVDCDEDAADPNLFGVYFNPGTILFNSFLELCYFYCLCSSGNGPGSSYFRDAIMAAVSGRVEQLENTTYPGLEQPGSSGTTMGQIGSSAIDGNESPAVQQVCGTNCTTDADCFGPGCKCNVQSSQVVPGSGIVKYTFGCGLRLTSKRDRMQPCACNASYISHSCCSSNGIVHEAPEFKLGVIDL